MLGAHFPVSHLYEITAGIIQLDQICPMSMDVLLTPVY